MEDRTISAVLKDLRHHAGLTQAALSKELHISRQVYSCYETGRRLPDLDTAVKLRKNIHKYFSTKRDCLFGNPFFLFIPCIRFCLHRWYNALFPAESSP